MGELTKIALVPGATLPNSERWGRIRISTADERILVDFAHQRVSPTEGTWFRCYSVAATMGEPLRIWLQPDLNAAPPHITPTPVRRIERVHSPQHRA